MLSTERDAADMVKQLESHPTYDMLSLACCLPEVKVVFEGLPAEDDTNARHVARNILKQYSASVRQYVRMGIKRLKKDHCTWQATNRTRC